jgi:hypothetical protein
VQTAGYELTADFITQPPWGARTPDPEEFDAVRAVDYCGSCSLLVRTDTWDRIGGADERIFPLYPVDIDLCLAIRMRGQRVLCAPASVLLHERGASITPDYAVFVQQRNRKLMLEKWGAALDGHVPGSGAVRELAPADLPLQVREADPERQALAQLIRGRDTLGAYARDFRSRLEGREADVAVLWERNAYLEARSAELEERNAESTGALAAAVPPAAEVAWLRERSETLTRVETGGWWRLRRLLLPVLHVAGAARRLFGARR